MYSYGVPGIYDVSLTVTTALSTDTETKTAHILVYNTVTSAITADDTTPHVCTDTVQFTSLANGANITAYNWSFGDGIVSALKNPTHKYMTSGLFDVAHIVNDSWPTPWNATATSINVNYITALWPTPGVAFTGVPASGDAILTVTFTDGSATSAAACGDIITTWLWTFGDGATSNLQNPTHTYPAGDAWYTVTLTATTSHGKSSLLSKTNYIHSIAGATGHELPWTPNFTFDTEYDYDIVCGTYMRHWLYNMTQGDFNLYGLAYSVMLPFMNVFGYWIFIIIWMTYLGIVWIRSGDVGMPLIIGLLSAGAWSLLFPQEALMYIGVMFAICLAVVVVRVFKD
jgi:PKD repeat protein